MALQKIPGRAIKLGTDTAGDVAYFDGSAWQRLAIGTPGQSLTMNQAGTLPHWGYCFGGDQFGYCHGGTDEPNLSVYTDTIDKFAFATDSNATDVGDLTVARRWAAGASTQSYGYAAGGYGNINVIERYQMVASANGVDVGDLYLGGGDGAAGVTSDTHGYYIREHPSNPSGQDIQKYALASSANATAVGDLTVYKDAESGTTSTTHGYIAGGQASPTNSIEKFSLSSDGNATVVGDLAYGTESGAAGTEY